MTPAEAGEHARRAGARRVVLTHISDELDDDWARDEAARGVRRPGRDRRARAPPTRSRPALTRSLVCRCARAETRPVRQLRAHAARDGPAVRRRLGAGRALAAGSRGFSPARRRLLLRREPPARRSSTPTSPGSSLDAVNIEISRPRAGDHRRAPGAGDRGPRLPAGRDPDRALPARRSSSASMSMPSAASATYEDGVLRVELPLAAARATPAGSRSSGTPSERPRASRGGGDRARGRSTAARRSRSSSPSEAEERSAPSEPLPEALPVLPLREMVTYPDTLTPLAVGQERSIKLVDDVLSGDRMLAWSPPRTPSSTSPGPTTSTTSASPASSRGCSRSPTARSGSSSRAPSGSGSAATSPSEPYLVARIEELPDVVEPRPELQALTRNVQHTFTRDHRADPLPARGAPARGHQHRRPVGAGPPDRRRAADRGRGEAGAARGGRRRARLRRLSEILARELEVIQLGSKIQSQVQSEIDKGQREYFLREQLKAIQDELGEGDEQQAEVNELRERIEAAELPEHARKAAERELGAAREAAAGGGRVRGDPHLPRVADRAALERADRGQPRHRARARGPRRRPLRPREGQGPNPRVPRGPQAQARLAGPDPLLRRAARRRQDEPRPLDRPRARAQVRADLGRRRPRRGRDPRPPPHLHRRDAGDDHPRAARRRLAQPGVHDRRDRQDGRRLPRRPGQRDARGPRPGPERLLPRPLPRPRLRPLRGHVHRHREHARPDPAAAPGPDGGDPARRLHGRREAPHRQALPRPAPDPRERPEGDARSSSPTRR